jgi:D-amino-acid oxidase
MVESIGIVGAGVSGLTCGVTLAERGYRTAIFAAETGQETTSGAAAAIWYPYDAAPTDQVIPWALATYEVLVQLAAQTGTGVSMLELRTFARAGEIPIPEWAIPLGARRLERCEISNEPAIKAGSRAPLHRAQHAGESHSIISETNRPAIAQPAELAAAFTNGFAMNVPLMDTTIYLDYLAQRFITAGGVINSGICLTTLQDISREFDLLVNCAGIGAKSLVDDADLESHRGQVVIVPRLAPTRAIVCDDPPLMYAIPRTKDCIFGGTNEISEDRRVNPAATSQIVAECSRALNIDQPKVLAEKVGLRPFRKSGVRVCIERLSDGRSAIHNYGHGGSGFTLSWGCAQKVFSLVQTAVAGPV